LKAKDELIKQGANIVIRSSRSLSPADLIGIFQDKKEIWLIQCKKQEAPQTRLTQKYNTLKKLEGVYTCKTFLYAKKQGKYQFISL
jgi:hypothetical protein